MSRMSIAIVLAGLGAAAPLAAEKPAAPANGEIGFVVETFVQPVVMEQGACPEGTNPKLRDVFLQSQTPEERTRLLLKPNEAELTKKWQAQAFGPKGTNLCSQPEAFDRPLMKTVQSPHAQGLDLDGDAGKGSSDPDSCEQQDFTSPDGSPGIDNQEYRVMGCTLEWRGVDGIGSDQQTGTRQFYASGEWTQVILLKGVDSLENDDAVDVIFGNTPDRPMADSKGKFLPGASFTISTAPPRHRNVLKGRIVNGVLLTEPSDIKLTQTWGQGGARDIRGNRTIWDFRKGRLQLTFQPDGSLSGLLGGYRPVFDVFQSASLGGAGSPLVAGIDCASQLATLRKYADGLRDPKTKQCTAVSSAARIVAIPAFVNDAPEAISGGGQ